jgi:beta-N-acetylhexosaminidase
MKLDHLAAPPFNLGSRDIGWVRDTAASLDLREKVAQLFVLLSREDHRQSLADMSRLQAGGVTRYHGGDIEHELDFAEGVLKATRVPPLVCADLEGSRLSFPFGTPAANPLALAAVDDVEATREISRIIALEASALGINWSFTPVVDINAAFRSPIVATRSFGSDIDRIERHALAHIEELQRSGLAATAKHWPGEGFDDRDQHLLTTVNPLPMEQWEQTFGRLYRRAIDAGVLAVMAGHIALPAFVRELDPEAGLEAYRPASLSSTLNGELLRKRLGFNGLIVSDASEMAGLTSWIEPRQGKVEIIKGGCDMILFSRMPHADVAGVHAAVESGEISRERLEDALSRVLGLKARLGLHTREAMPRAARRDMLGRVQSRALSRAVSGRAPTLVKDVDALFPLSLRTHRRVLIVTGGIVDPMHGPSAFVLPELMRGKGFEVAVCNPGDPIETADRDLVLYVMGEETLLTRGRIFLDWARLGGGSFINAMSRTWHEVPTALLSFGFPYYLYDAPRMPAVVNAYSTLDDMQEAVLDCMLGDKPFNRNSPVDPFCGLEDARF